MKTWYVLCMWVCFVLHINAQKVIVSGTITDSSSGEALIQAGIVFIQKDVLKITTVTDYNGMYRVEIDTGCYDIHFRYVGFLPKIISNVDILKNTNLCAILRPGICLEEVTIGSKRVPITTRDITNSGSIRGSRTNATVYYLDGIRYTGSSDAKFKNKKSNKKSKQDKTTSHRPEPLSVQKPKYYNTSVEEYARINENDFKATQMNPLSTLSIDVDRAAYSNVRRFIQSGETIPKDAVRIEEMINYFDYKYPEPKGEHPYQIISEISSCPWNPDHQLLLIALQGKTLQSEKLPPSHLTFLIDVSGSMEEENKLPLVISSLKLLVNQLRSQDKISLVVYAGSSGMVLKATSGSDKQKIHEALDQLRAGGSTAGAAGIELAYKTATEEYIKDGNNRVVLCTDGDFNVGISNANDLEELIVQKRKTGVFLTCLGFGMGNYKDDRLKTLADKGNGNYAYIDTREEAKKTLLHEFGGTIFTIAKDVKFQIEFNPSKTQSYRLIGYEDRLLNEEDFTDDEKDAGEMGAGHVVTALYELIPYGVTSKFATKVEKLKYQSNQVAVSSEIATIKTRYKLPNESKSKAYNEIANDPIEFNMTSDNFKWAASVAMFGLVLRDSKYKQQSDINKVLQFTKQSLGNDEHGYRSEFISLVHKVKDL